MAGLPKHFSLISAQRGPEHDEKAHKALLADLEGLGLKVTAVSGKYGHPEKSFMVEHPGREEDKSAVDALGRKYQQDSVLHSSFRSSRGGKGAHHNELRHLDGRPPVMGRGYRVSDSISDYYTDHPSIGRFQMHLDHDDTEANKAISIVGSPISSQAAAPGPIPKTAPVAMRVQARVPNPPRQKFVKAPIVSSTTPAVNPKSIQSPAKIPSAKPTKIKIAKSDIVKAMMHQDGETMIDSRSHAAAVDASPQPLMDWGSKHLVPMRVNDVKHLKVANSVIKVTKKGPDLYAGWVENEANIGHKFERLTLPQLLLQLQSALELYGREDQIANTEVLHSDHAEEEKLQEKKKELTELGQAISEVIDENVSEADKQAKIKEKLEALRAKVKSEEIPAKELAEGLESPEEVCPACEQPAEECSCYEGLSTPRLEFDGRKVTIFFKSDWNAEDKDNFKDDLKRRAGIILRKREEARSVALSKAKRLIDTVRKKKK